MRSNLKNDYFANRRPGLVLITDTQLGRYVIIKLDNMTALALLLLIIIMPPLLVYTGNDLREKSTGNRTATDFTQNPQVT